MPITIVRSDAMSPEVDALFGKSAWLIPLDGTAASEFTTACRDTRADRLGVQMREIVACCSPCWAGRC